MVEFGHVRRRPIEALERRINEMEIEEDQEKTIGQTIKRVLKINMLLLNLIHGNYGVARSM